MKKHAPADEMLKDLDNLLSKLNAMEVTSKDDYQKNTITVLRALVEGQMHSIREFEHLKIAIDLLTMQLFEVQKKANS